MQICFCQRDTTPVHQNKNPMLEAITWNHYFSTLALGLTAYYLGIAVLYYPQELRGLISGKAMQFNLNPRQEKERHLSKTGAKEIDPLEELEITVAELKGILGRAGNLTDPYQLLDQLRNALSNHTGLREPAHRVAIYNFLQGHIPKYTPYSFSESELKSLWKE